MFLDQAITSLQQDLARLAQLQQVAEEPPTDAAQLARLQAAQAALKLAAVLLDATDPIAAAPIWEQFNAVSLDLTRWQRSGRGWFEERLVRRGLKLHGPYRYFRWRDEEGKTHTHYLGRIESLPAVQPEPPIPAALHPAEPSAWRGRVQPVRIGSTKKVHLMLPEPGETTTLCGRSLGAQPLRTIVFQYDDCALPQGGDEARPDLRAVWESPGDAGRAGDLRALCLGAACRAGMSRVLSRPSTRLATAMRSS